MFFSLLTVGQFAALLGLAATTVTFLYLLERNKQRRVVSTLRFWKNVPRARSRLRRHRVQQPWSLLLQIAGITLLCLALAGLHWGNRAQLRSHVLLLDTSSSALARSGTGTVLDAEKRWARRYLAQLGSTDRLLVVEAGGLVTPATPFLAPGTQLERAITDANASPTALDFDGALTFAERALDRSPAGTGDIVYTGSGRVSQPVASLPDNVRVLPVITSRENCGIVSLTAHRSGEPGNWLVTAHVQNDGPTAQTISLHGSFGATAFAPRAIHLNPHSAADVPYAFVASTGGKMHLSITPADDFMADNQATLPLPENRATTITVITARPAAFGPLIAANPRIAATYLRPSEYRPDLPADLVILDQFAPPIHPDHPSLWIDPPPIAAPVPVAAVLNEARIDAWTDDRDLGRGLHSRDLHLGAAHALQTFSGDIEVASAAGKPVVVARTDSSTRQRLAVAGFDLLSPGLRFQVSSPLLAANLLRWLEPDAFDLSDIACQAAGLRREPVRQGDDASLRVLDDAGAALPFTVQNGELRFFADRTGQVRIASAEGTRTVYISLPQVGLYRSDFRNVPASRLGLPPQSLPGLRSVDLWRVLAAAGGLILLLEWILFRQFASRLRWTLKYAAAVALIVSLVEPALQLPRNKVGAVALVDTSASIGSQDLAHASSAVKQLARQHGSHWFSVLPFASQPRHLETTALSRPTDADSDNTDLEAALIEGAAAVPAGYTPRLLLFSDGNETRGSAARAMRFLQTRDVPVDVIPLRGGSLAHVTIPAIALPSDVYAGEQIPLSLTVDSPVTTHGIVRFTAEGKPIGVQDVQLNAGANIIHAHVRLEGTGAIAVQATIDADKAGRAQSNTAVNLRRPKILYVSGDLPPADANLLSALRSGEFDVDTHSDLNMADLAAAQLVILNNLDLNTITLARKEALARYVEAGGGLLLLGGEHQTYKEDAQMDVLDRVLPAKLAPPRNPEGICVALIVDKSSSMEGRKIDLARLSAIGVVDHLRERDTIGVLIFDNSYQWAVPMRRADDKPLIRSLISGITPDGGTQIAPALSEAYRKVMRSSSVYKHIVLMTDGISEEGDSLDLAREALMHQVTISTVGLGQDVNRSYLEKVAAASGGKSYFLSDPQGLEQVLLKDVEQYEGKTAVEKSLAALVQTKAEMLEGVDWEHAPSLKGYARYEAKPGAEVLLAVDGEKRDPLFVQWPFGLGRVGVWTSDAKSRWAQDWVTWPGFDKFWTNSSRELMTRSHTANATAQWDAADAELRITYQMDGGVEPRTPVYAIGPDGFSERVTLHQSNPGVWQGSVRTGNRTGFFRIRPLEDSRQLPEIGVYRVNEEFRNRTANEPLLRELASVTGGDYDAAPESIFRQPRSSTLSETPLWPALLALVLALTVAELACRKLTHPAHGDPDGLSDAGRRDG